MDIVDELNGSPEPNAETQTSEPQAAEPTPAEPQAETPEQTATRERDERGRFKAKDEQPMVPLAALHETRDKVRDLEARLQEMTKATPQAEAAPPPDMFSDPEGWQAHQATQLQMATLNTTLNLSESMAKRYAGADAVEEAKAWGTQAFAENPQLYTQFLQQPDPYGFLIDQHKRASTFAKLGDDPSQIEAFLAWKEAQAAPQQTQQAIPTSLASAQSARGNATPYQPPSLEELLKGK